MPDQKERPDQQISKLEHEQVFSTERIKIVQVLEQKADLVNNQAGKLLQLKLKRKREAKAQAAATKAKKAAKKGKGKGK